MKENQKTVRVTPAPAVGMSVYTKTGVDNGVAIVPPKSFLTLMSTATWNGSQWWEVETSDRNPTHHVWVMETGTLMRNAEYQTR
jgi:hypothetical protein